MGNSPSTPELGDSLSKFKSYVLFTDAEIYKLFRRFERLGGGLDTPISMDVFVNIPELKHNPFRNRFARVFGEYASEACDPQSPTNANNNNIGNKTPIAEHKKLTKEQLLVSSQDLKDMYITFDSFLKFLSSASYRSDFKTKARLAFSLYDFDQDGSISTLDIECMLVLAMGETQLHPAQYKQIAHEVMAEVDIDGSGTLTELEFSRVLVRLQDFESRITLEIEFD